tara:strand:- start:206 stop:631 length:426 start_codon:yes stop_codon:yes gene_type:complete
MKKIFVYGTLKQHQPNFTIIKSGVFCGVGKLHKSHGFRMVSLGAFPALIPANPEQSQDIHGEIWNVDKHAFKNVEYLEGYPTFYNRVKIPVMDSKNKEHECFVYFIPDKLSSKELLSVDMGTWLGKDDSLYGITDSHSAYL